MKNQLFIIPFVCVMLWSVGVFGEDGCLVPGYPELLTYQSTPGGAFSNDPAIYPSMGCWWALIDLRSGCVGHGRGGTRGTYEMQCPIDDYTPILIIFTVCFSLTKLMNQSIMQSIKISIITAVYNGQKYLNDCITSVRSQDYANIEYIVIDGGSTDRTLSIIEKHADSIAYVVSEKDLGIYDALNKGIAAATGDVIGILNADDVLASPDVITKIAAKFADQDLDGVYGNLNYVSENRSQIIRKWKSSPFTIAGLKNGWMPAHPTLYLKRKLFKKFGDYALDFGTAADYELILRFFYKYKVNAEHLDLLLVDMRIGGMSNANVWERLKAVWQDYRAIRTNGIPFAIKTVLLKKLNKIPQFLT